MATHDTPRRRNGDSPTGPPHSRKQSSLKKVFRFVCIYGLRKTLFKVLGRMRVGRVNMLLPPAKVRDIGVIGCGQFATSTIAYSIFRRYGNRFVSCFDPDAARAASFAAIYRVESAKSANALIEDPRVRVVYIASNHASHAGYAIAALRAGKATYVEKPIAVSTEQLTQLYWCYGNRAAKMFAGYNRPFSRAIADLRGLLNKVDGPLTLSCFISGHVIPVGHWYRNPDEGTRICGNVGHWLDLMIHLLSCGDLPDTWDLSLHCSDVASRDEDFTFVATSSRHDLVTITLTARAEPFEGINESINFQWGNVIAKIDDFRSMTVWSGSDVRRFRYWPKDVGHNQALLQPFDAPARDWREVELSTVLMLFVKDMVVSGVNRRSFSFSEAWRAIVESGRGRDTETEACNLRQTIGQL